MYTLREVEVRDDIFGPYPCDKWISVFDWLPPLEHDVFISYHGLIHIGQRKAEVNEKGKKTGKWVWINLIKGGFTEPTYWMPLPPPPSFLEMSDEEFYKRLQERDNNVTDKDHWWYYTREK